MTTLTDISLKLKTLFISKLNDIYKKKSLSSNVVFSIVLVIAEKIVETDFTCPCGAECRVHLLVLLFIVPGLVVSVLFTAIQQLKLLPLKCSCAWIKNAVKKFCVCIFPAVVWVTLLFLDGRYYTCLKTDWPGQYVTVNHSVLKKWCEPDNMTLHHEGLKKSFGWYTCSQTYGFYLLGGLAALVFIIVKLEGESSAGSENNTQNQAASGENVTTSVPLQTSAQSPTTSGENVPPTDTTPV